MSYELDETKTCRPVNHRAFIDFILSKRLKTRIHMKHNVCMPLTDDTMIATTKNPLTRLDPLPSRIPIRVDTPTDSSSPLYGQSLPDILSTSVLHKRRSPKRVRFAPNLGEVEEDKPAAPSIYINSPLVQSNKKVIDPWRRDGPLYGAYIEYLEKQGALTDAKPQAEPPASLSPLPPPPPPPVEPESSSAAYTHTFVIRSNSPELVIDSITISSPPLYLPRIVKKTTSPANKNHPKQPSPIMENKTKQHLPAAASPTTSRPIRSNKPKSPSTNSNPRYLSLHTQSNMKRVDLALPASNGSQPNSRIMRPDNPLNSMLVANYLLPNKFTELVPKSQSDDSNNFVVERPILPNMPKKPQMPCRMRFHDGANIGSPYLFHAHDIERLAQPVIHSTR